MTYKVTVPATVEFTDEEWEDTILGSGFDTLPWWRDVDYTRATKTVTLLVLDPEDTDKWFRAQFSLEDVAITAASVANRNSHIAHALAEQDLDAGDVDLLIQNVVFRREIYI